MSEPWRWSGVGRTVGSTSCGAMAAYSGAIFGAPCEPVANPVTSGVVPNRFGIVAPSPIPSDSRRRSPPPNPTTMMRLPLPAACARLTLMSGDSALVAATAPSPESDPRRKLRRFMARSLLALVLARSRDRADDGSGTDGGILDPLVGKRAELVRVRLAAVEATELLGDVLAVIGDRSLLGERDLRRVQESLHEEVAHRQRIAETLEHVGELHLLVEREPQLRLAVHAQHELVALGRATDQVGIHAAEELARRLRARLALATFAITGGGRVVVVRRVRARGGKTRDQEEALHCSKYSRDATTARIRPRTSGDVASRVVTKCA